MLSCRSRMRKGMGIVAYGPSGNFRAITSTAERDVRPTTTHKANRAKWDKGILEADPHIRKFWAVERSRRPETCHRGAGHHRLVLNARDNERRLSYPHRTSYLTNHRTPRPRQDVPNGDRIKICERRLGVADAYGVCMAFPPAMRCAAPSKCSAPDFAPR